MNVSFVGNFNSTGIGRHSEGVFRALERQPQLPWSLHYVDMQREESVREWATTRSGRGDASLFFWRMDANVLRQIAGRKIGWIFFESDKIPRPWLEQLHAFDELWMPSEWARELLLAHGFDASRIEVVTSGIEAQLYRPQPVAHEGFVFLMVGKHERRKSVEETIEAFGRAFPQGSPEAVELWLKVDHPLFPERIEALRSACSPDRRIRFVRPGLSDAGMASLYNRADAFVYPTKAEGFGLPTIEAMACGLPVITTNYSAQATFLQHVPGLFREVEFDLGEIVDPDHDHFYGADYAGTGYGRWALPRIESVAAAMREVHGDIEAWRGRAREASARIRERFSWERVAQRAREAITGSRVAA
jgi:glycosyltransferase involved in cell wall biosynthesis